MVVIAPQRFHQALETIVSYRAKQRPTKLVSLETIVAQNQGHDDPEKLKRWLYNAWKKDQLRYVLLVGDADLVPVRYMVLDRVTPAAFDYAFYPSDLYYADVARRDGSFDDWNASKHGFHAIYFGEVRGEKNKSGPINFDRIDYRPELAFGRWPVDSEDEVRMVTEKTIAYERELSTSRRDLHRAAFVWVPGWVDARGQINRWASNLPRGWTSTKLEGGNPKDKRADENHVLSLMNQGAALVVHVGHGEDNGWADSLHTGGLKQLRNADRLPVVLSAGCSTALRHVAAVRAVRRRHRNEA